MEVENYPILEVTHLGGTCVSTSMIMGGNIFPTALVVEKHQMYLIYIGPTGKMILPKNQQGPFNGGWTRITVVFLGPQNGHWIELP